MGVEKEKADTCVFMDEAVFHSTIEPMLKKKKEKARASPPEPRDPGDLNAHLKVDFQDVIGEPASAHSLDSVWIGSHALFALVKFVLYRVLTAVLAVPMAFMAGLAFAVLSCVHIWLLMPLIHSCMVTLPALQLIWSSLMKAFVRPVFRSAGACLSSTSGRSCESPAP